MSHQIQASADPIREPHLVSVKVLRLSRPALVTQYPLEAPLSTASKGQWAAGSLAWAGDSDESGYDNNNHNHNPAPFLLSPMLKLPVSFGSAYVGETFSCTLCANNEVASDSGKRICDVRIEAEMKTPGHGAAHTLELGPVGDSDTETGAGAGTGMNLEADATIQKVVSFDLKDEGNHVLAVTVSYYEASETSGRTRTFRKLYQFACKPSLIVRTKIGILEDRHDENHDVHDGDNNNGKGLHKNQKTSKRRKSRGFGGRRWVLEAQLENCCDDILQLERVVMQPDMGFRSGDCNWETSGGEQPVLHPGEVEQVCFVIAEEEGEQEMGKEEREVNKEREDKDGGGRIMFGTLGIGWRGQMGNRGFLSTGQLGTRQRGRKSDAGLVR